MALLLIWMNWLFPVLHFYKYPSNWEKFVINSLFSPLSLLFWVFFWSWYSLCGIFIWLILFEGNSDGCCQSCVDYFHDLVLILGFPQQFLYISSVLLESKLIYFGYRIILVCGLRDPWLFVTAHRTLPLHWNSCCFHSKKILDLVVE